MHLLLDGIQITKRGDTVDEKIKKLDAELSRYKEQIKKTRPGPAQDAVKARAMRVLKQKRMYVAFFLCAEVLSCWMLHVLGLFLFACWKYRNSLSV